MKTSETYLLPLKKDGEPEESTKDDLLKTAKTFYRMSFPVIISRMAIFINFYNVVLSATFHNETKIAAVGLANSILCIFSTYFILGFMMPLETLTS